MTDLPFSSGGILVGRRHSRPRRRNTRVALVLAGGLALVPGGSELVAAQPVESATTEVRTESSRPEPRVTPQLAMARICASEIGLTGSPEECAAIHDVLSRRAERQGMPFTWMARAYSSRVFDVDRSDPRAWIAHLRPDGRAPAGWPSEVRVRRGGETRVVRHAPWGAYRERWLTLYEAAGRVVRGEITSPCEGRVDHWGMRSGIDWERARRAGWDEVNCGETRNAFWRVPDRHQG
ncbi:MAG: hypothetical protein M3Y87_35460 [Myxococcota bacterium]|nr:hypothetical protein [Myxococcota bacterium]